MRLYFAHSNAVENLVVFAPLVLILQFAQRLHLGDGDCMSRCSSGHGSPTQSSMRWVYPSLRTVAFTVGFICQVVLVLAIFRVF